MRADQQPVQGDLPAVGRVRALDQPSDPAVALDGGDVESDPGLLDQGAEAAAAEHGVGVEQLHPGFWYLEQNLGELRPAHPGRDHARVVHPLVLHPDGDLHEQPAPGRRGQQPEYFRVVERVSMVRRIEPDAAHLVLLVAAPQVLFPVRPGRVNAADGDQ